MSALALFASGDLAGCLAQLQSDVRRQPADGKLRVFLAQLLMVTGAWDRALIQLAVAAELDSGALPMLHAYGAAIQCERLRAQVFRGERSPLVFGEPLPWIAALVQALALEASGKTEAAATLRNDGLAAATATTGTLNGQPFEWVADADSRLGPILEVILNGAYYWVPVHRISKITIDAPSDARDLVWLPAQFTWTNQGEAIGFIPVRYSGSDAVEDDAIRLARKTEWKEVAPEVFQGQGQRLILTDANEYGLLEVREIALHAAA